MTTTAVDAVNYWLYTGVLHGQRARRRLRLRLAIENKMTPTTTTMMTGTVSPVPIPVDEGVGEGDAVYVSVDKHIFTLYSGILVIIYRIHAAACH